MKEIKDMTVNELKEEIKYMVSLLDDDTDMFAHCSLYTAALIEEFGKRYSK